MSTATATDVLAETVQSLEELDRAHARSYWLIVKEIGDSRRVAPERVKSILAASGKSTDDLAHDVARYRTRVELAAVLKKADSLQGERAAHEKKLTVLQAEAFAAQQRAIAAAAPLHARLEEIRAVEKQAGAARAQMERDDPYPEVAEQMSALSKKMAGVSGRLSAMGKAIALRSEGESSNAPGWHGGAFEHPDNKADRIARGQAIIAAADEAEKELPALQKEFESLRAEETDLRKLLLIP